MQLSDGALGVSRWERLNRRERTRQLLAGGVVLSEGVPAAATTPFSRRGGEESVRSFLARPPDHPYEVAGRETYYTRFRGSLRRLHCYTPAVHDTVASHPPSVKQWRRWQRSLLQGALGEGGGGGGSSGGRVKRSLARLTGTRGGGGGGSAAGGRAGETPPPRDWLGVRARSIRETIPLSPPSLPRLSHIPARHPTVITALYTFFFEYLCFIFSRYFPKPADRLTEQPLLFYA